MFLHELSGIFTIDSPPNLAAQHINLCQEVLFLFRQIFVEMYESLHKETQYVLATSILTIYLKTTRFRETLMYTVLNTTTTLLKDRKNQTLADNLSSTMVDVRVAFSSFVCVTMMRIERAGTFRRCSSCGSGRKHARMNCGMLSKTYAADC